ncbi:MAG: sensor histidine kinase [Catonella sp.]|uniref:sensor histidine kinase n=1 Tax=Catonella sp. TaxID=2382125 RepID=UPI003FA10EEC
MKKKKLLHRIFVIPSLIVLFSLLAVFVLFQIISDQYMNTLTSDALKNEMSNMGNVTFDTYENTETVNDELADTSLIVPVMHLVIDANRQLVFPTSPWYYDYEVKIAQSIADIIADEPNSYKTSPHKLNVNDNFYLVQAKNYMGVMEDGAFIPDESDKNSKNYYVLFYINITPMQNFINKVNLVLMAALALSGIGSIFFLFLTTRQVNKDFEKLKSYLLSIGKHKNEKTVSPVSNYSEIEAVITAVDEMSKMLLESENVQKRFFQNASHELRTPLMSIQGYAEGIKYHVISENEATDVILKESEKMASLINEILFLSKMETTEPEFENVNIADLVKEVSDNFRLMAKENNITILCETSVEPIISGNLKLLDRLIGNLVSNGIRYAKSEIKLSCELFNKEVIIKVADDGNGIDADDLPHIFERFYKGKGGKFGIGLSIASDIAKLHKGRLEVTSDESGTVFMLSLRTDTSF